MAIAGAGTTDNAAVAQWLRERTADEPVRTVIGDFHWDERGLPIGRDFLVNQATPQGIGYSLTDEAARRGNELQYRLQEGPCLDAIWTEDTVHSRDLTIEERWSTWGPLAAVELGFRSMLLFQLFTGRVSLGALNLYGDRTSAFSEADVTMGYALAAHVSALLAEPERLPLPVECSLELRHRCTPLVGPVSRAGPGMIR